MPLSLGDLVKQEDLGLKLVTGTSASLRRSVAGAHAIEIANPTRWLDKHWVLLTTGIRLRGDAAAQRALVAEAAEKSLTAIGFGIEVIFRSVPAALLDEAERRSFPLFTIAPETPFREIIGFVDRSLASDDFRVLRRRVTIESSLAEAMASENPEEALVRRLGSLVEASVVLYSLDGRVATSVGAAPREAIWHELRADPSRTRFTVGRWLVVAEPVLTGDDVRRWLTVATRRRGLSEELVVGVVRSAARLLGVVDLAREAMRAGERTLRAELLDQLLDPARGTEVPPERLAAFGFDADRETRVAVLELESRSEESAAARASETGRAARIVESAAHGSGCPSLVAVRRGRLTVIFQERERDLEDWTARLAAQGFHPLAGVGRPFLAGGKGALDSLRDADLAVEQLRRAPSGPRRSLRFEDLGLAEWLLASADARVVDKKAETSLAALRGHPELLRTLLVYLDCDLEVPRTARRLHLHENSLRYRLRRIEAILGRSLRDLATVVDLHLATTTERSALHSQRPAETAPAEIQLARR
jgi:purine catabolism regulator